MNQHRKGMKNVSIWLPEELVARLGEVQAKTGKTRTDIIKALIESKTAAQIVFTLVGGALPPPTKPAVTPPPSVPPRSFSPAPKKGAK